MAIHYANSGAEARATAKCGGAPLFRASLEGVAEIARMFGGVANARSAGLVFGVTSRKRSPA